MEANTQRPSLAHLYDKSPSATSVAVAGGASPPLPEEQRMSRPCE